MKFSSELIFEFYFINTSLKFICEKIQLHFLDDLIGSRFFGDIGPWKSVACKKNIFMVYFNHGVIFL